MSLALEIAALHGISSGTYHPYNVVTGKPYQGKNIAILEVAAIKINGTNDPRWMTFLQAKELGYKVKKGEHGTQIEKWKFDSEVIENTDGEKKTKTRALRRVYTLFHASQVEGIPALSEQK